MAVIQIPFPKKLSSVSTTRGHVKNLQVVPEEEPQNDVLEAIGGIAAAIDLLQQQRQEQFGEISAKLIATACQIARDALGSENELIEQRVNHFTKVLLDELQESKDAIIFVHPTLVETLSQHEAIIQKGSIEILPDTTVAPGDCRVEIEGKGLLASLDAYLDAASLRLRQEAGGTR
ncbi:hypothetical protein LOC67_15675 [Stieleria sp. JC731]|uniref:FliH/SctL family protein n=1 Tax=Pirellulaceae TaxID=2691357 RepID=UPI001E3D7DC9|nr:FliH/SctL family protein [Stieleria sp. JC731]MCC9602001.1 hypothetical protein [Stieleria sp. JC731]